jgi:hypothetical protein
MPEDSGPNMVVFDFVVACLGALIYKPYLNCRCDCCHSHGEPLVFGGSFKPETWGCWNIEFIDEGFEIWIVLVEVTAHKSINITFCFWKVFQDCAIREIANGKHITDPYYHIMYVQASLMKESTVGASGTRTTLSSVLVLTDTGSDMATPNCTKYASYPCHVPN